MQSVFVIAPRAFDPDWGRKRSILTGIAKDLNQNLVIPDYEHGHDVERQSSISALMGADVVLADLSYERPSSYYELGFAEALGKPVVPIAKAGTSIHQTRYRDVVAQYDSLANYEQLVRRLLQARSPA